MTDTTLETSFEMPRGSKLHVLVDCDVEIRNGELDVTVTRVSDGEKDVSMSILGAFVKRSLERDLDFCERAADHAGFEWVTDGNRRDLSCGGHWECGGERYS